MCGMKQVISCVSWGGAVESLFSFMSTSLGFNLPQFKNDGQGTLA